MEQTKFNKSFFNSVEPIKIKDPLAIALAEWIGHGLDVRSPLLP